MNGSHGMKIKLTSIVLRDYAPNLMWNRHIYEVYISP